MFFDDRVIGHVTSTGWRRSRSGDADRGSRRMIVYDDLEASEKIKVYDKGSRSTESETLSGLSSAIARGDMWVSAAADHRGAARGAKHFLECIGTGRLPAHRRRRRPQDRRLLEAATQSMRTGRPVPMPPPPRHCDAGVGPSPSHTCTCARSTIHQAESTPRSPACSESTQYVLGDEVLAFEQAFARIAPCVSGRSQLGHERAAPGAAGTRHRARDEVITVSVHVCSQPLPIEYAGARPVLVDIEPEYFTLDPALLEAAITPRTRPSFRCTSTASPDMRPILEIASVKAFPLIEDAAQAHGSAYEGRRADRSARWGLQLLPGKEPRRLWQGGALVTSDPVCETGSAAAQLGEERRSAFGQGIQLSMDGLQGAVLAVKLEHLESVDRRTRDRAGRYRRALAGTAVRLPAERPAAAQTCTTFRVAVPERDALRTRLAGAASRQACITPSRFTCSRPIAISDTSPATSRI